ncbi:MAG: hypothetical protein ACRDD1_01825, partial [Planctomycetia bacterium]
LNDELRPYVAARPAEARGKRARAVERWRAEGVLRSREFAYCVHPTATVDRLLAAMKLDERFSSAAFGVAGHAV